VERRRRATLKDVAAATGLSTAAVSYALRGLHVPVETQDRVRAAARELGYEANPIARALASGRTGTVGVLCGSLDDLWLQSLAAALSRGLMEHDRHAIIADSAGDPDRERMLAMRLRDQQVDGMLASPLDPAAEFWGEISAEIPVVTIGDAMPAAPRAGCVLFDNRYGVATALGHLAELGHRRVALLRHAALPTTPDRPADAFARQHGAELGLDVVAVSSPASVAGAAAAAEEVLRGPDAPTAMFCLSDSMAYGCYLAARRLGLDVPADVSVLGYDDRETAELVVPALTTFRWDQDGIVAAAVSQLVAAIDGSGEHRTRVFRPSLVARDSTARVQTPSGRSSSV
jgi:LacI family transcriptional regulator